MSRSERISSSFPCPPDPDWRAVGERSSIILSISFSCSSSICVGFRHLLGFSSFCFCVEAVSHSPSSSATFQWSLSVAMLSSYGMGFGRFVFLAPQENYKLHFDTDFCSLQVVVLVPPDLTSGTRKMHCKSSNLPRPFFFPVRVLVLQNSCCLWSLPRKLQFWSDSSIDMCNICRQMYIWYTYTMLFSLIIWALSCNSLSNVTDIMRWCLFLPVTFK